MSHKQEICGPGLWCLAPAENAPSILFQSTGMRCGFAESRPAAVDPAAGRFPPPPPAPVIGSAVLARTPPDRPCHCQQAICSSMSAMSHDVLHATMTGGARAAADVRRRNATCPRQLPHDFHVVLQSVLPSVILVREVHHRRHETAAGRRVVRSRERDARRLGREDVVLQGRHQPDVPRHGHVRGRRPVTVQSGRGRHGFANSAATAAASGPAARSGHGKPATSTAAGIRLWPSCRYWPSHPINGPAYPKMS